MRDGRMTWLKRGAVPLLLLGGSLAWAAVEDGVPDLDDPVDVVAGVDPVPGSVSTEGVAITAADGSQTVATSSGSFQGSVPDADGIRSWKGIPYAAAPVGPLRWRAPQPYPAATGVRPATAYGNACLAAPGPNPSVNDAVATQSEDCLTLNVWTPAGTTAKSAKPVMVWIHGGGFQFSSSSRPTWDGTNLARRDVIVVSINYRLGIFGFLATPQFDAESGHSGAWGLLDQLAALRWVQANIAKFGGDPRKVTLFGESAGAHSVGLLMTSPKAKGLFSRAILQSGATWDTEHGSIDTHDQALEKGQRLMARFSGQELRSLPAAVVQAAGPWDYLSDPTITAYTPSLDGEVLTDAPMNVFRQRRQLAIPTLGGWNAAEWFPFPARVLPAAPAALFHEAGARLFGRRCQPEFVSLYPATDPTNAEASAMQLQGDLGIAQQTWEALAWQARVAKSYAYQFGYTSPYSPIAIHTAEVPFVFGTLTRQALAPAATPSDADRRMSDLMVAYWTNFAKRGDPNASGLPHWPEIGNAGAEVMRLDAVPGAATNSDLARFRFIARYREAGRLPAAWRSLAAPYAGQYEGPGCP